MSCIILPRRAIGGIPVDVVVSEKHESEMEIATHPIEKGAEVADHAWRKPRKVTLACASAGGPGNAFAMASWAALQAVQKRAEPFDVVTGLAVYQNMLLQNLTADRDKEKSLILSFEATLQEVIIVSSQETAGSGGGDSSQAGKGGTDRNSTPAARGSVQPRPIDAPALFKGSTATF